MPPKVHLFVFMRYFIKIFLWIFGTLMTLSLLLTLILLLPPVQNVVVNKASHLLFEKTGLKARIGFIHLSFPKTINIGEVLVHDLAGDTLLYSRQLDLEASLFALMKQKINIELLRINGLVVNLHQDHDSAYNFSPLVNAFQSSEKTSNKSDEPPWDFNIDRLKLLNIRASFERQIDSSSYFLNLGALDLSANSIDIQEGIIDLDNIKLARTTVDMQMGNANDAMQPLPNKPGSLPFKFLLDKLSISDFQINITSSSGDFELSANLGHGELLTSNIDLANTSLELHQINIDRLGLSLKQLPANENELDQMLQASGASTQTAMVHTFGTFDWDVKVDRTIISNMACRVDLDDQTRKPSGIDYRHFELFDMGLVAEQLFSIAIRAAVPSPHWSLKKNRAWKFKNYQGVFSWTMSE